MIATIATPALRNLLVSLLKGEIRKATVARAEAAEEFLLLPESDQNVLRLWLGTGRPPCGSCGRQVVRQMLDKHFPQ